MTAPSAPRMFSLPATIKAPEALEASAAVCSVSARCVVSAPRARCPGMRLGTRHGEQRFRHVLLVEFQRTWRLLCRLTSGTPFASRRRVNHRPLGDPARAAWRSLARWPPRALLGGPLVYSARRPRLPIATCLRNLRYVCKCLAATRSPPRRSHPAARTSSRQTAPRLWTAYPLVRPRHPGHVGAVRVRVLLLRSDDRAVRSLYDAGWGGPRRTDRAAEIFVGARNPSRPGVASIAHGDGGGVDASPT